MTSSSQTQSPIADVIYDSVYAGGFGGSAVALFFFVVDLLDGGEGFATPSLMGSVLFLGASPESVTEINMQAVAYYTLAHFAIFGLLGFLLALLVHEVELHSRHPIIIFATAFLIFEGAFFGGAMFWMPEVLEVIGPGRIAWANALGALAMSAFLLHEHRPDLWQKLKE